MIKKDVWNDDSVQFPRLLAEINAIGLSEEQYEELGELMDLEVSEINELFNRAISAFENNKRQILGGR